MDAEGQSKLIAVIYTVVGVVFAWIVPRLDELNGSMYSNWHSVGSILVQPFRWPWYMWLTPFLGASLLVWFASSWVKGRHLTLLNIGFSAALIFLVFHFFDWAYQFVFCHEWGCGRGLSPLWLLFH